MKTKLDAADIKLKWQVEMGTDWGGNLLVMIRHDKTDFLKAQEGTPRKNCWGVWPAS